MTSFHELLTAAGSPLEATLEWDEETVAHVREVTTQAVREAHERWPGDQQRAIQHVLVGLFAHGFLIGRVHARSGLALPGSARRTLAGLSLGDVPDIAIPDDISEL